MFFVILIFIISIVLFFAYLFPSFYFSELVLSFLPYIVLFTILAFATQFVLLKNKKVWIYAKFSPLFILLFGLLFFLYSKDYTNFYNWNWFDQQEWTGINVLYSNILYKNHNYTGILDWINQYDADVVLMVEFTDEHYQNMKEILHDKYPYSARTSWSQKYFWNVVFSKYPIDNLTDNVDQWTWRYSHFNLKHNDKNYYFYLVHTSSPVAYKFFIMRNKQFNILMNDFEKHDLEQSQNNHVMVLWDFNVSPWSIYYKKLEAVMSGFKNMTKNFRILFTWRIKLLPFIISHIDHIFIDDDSVVSNITKLNTPGSDHRWFFIENFR